MDQSGTHLTERSAQHLSRVEYKITLVLAVIVGCLYCAFYPIAYAWRQVNLRSRLQKYFGLTAHRERVVQEFPSPSPEDNAVSGP